MVTNDTPISDPNPVRVVPIESSSDLVTRAFAETDNCIYRGQADASWPLAPGGLRGVFGGPHGTKLERRLDREYRRGIDAFHHPPTTPKSLYEVRVLAEMQHMGLPTLLLDWSESPLVGLYFAVRDHVLSPDAMRGCASTMSDDLAVYSLNTTQHWKLLEGWHDEHRNAFPDPEPRYNDTDGDLEDFEQISKESTYPPIVIPHASHPRIVAQNSVFTMHHRGDSHPFDLRTGAGLYITKYTAKKSTARQLFNQLRKLGICESVLFPDADGFCRELRARVTSNL